MRQFQPYYYRFFLPLCGVFVLYLIVMLGLSLLVDKQQIAQEIQVHIEAKTGRQWNTSNEMEISFLPSPKFTIHRIQMTNDYRAEDNNFMAAQRVELEIPWGEILNDAPNPSQVRLIGADIGLEKYADGGDNWSSLEGIMRDRSAGDVKLSLIDSRIHYYDKERGYELDFKPLEATVTLGNRVEFSGKAKLADTLLSMKANCSIGLASYPRPFESECRIEHKEGENIFSFEGGVVMDGKKNLTLEGKAGVDAQNLLPTLSRWMWNDSVLKDAEEPLALKADGVLRLGERSLFADITQLSSGESTAKAVIDFKHGETHVAPNILNLDFYAKTLKLQDIQGITPELVHFFANKVNKALADVSGMAGTVSIGAQSIGVGDRQAATNAIVRGAWNGRTLDISEMKASLEEGDISAQGYMYGGASSLQTNLAYNLQGKNLQQTLAAMGVELPDIGVPYGERYQSSGQLILRDNALLVSKSETTLGDVVIKGGVNYLFDRGEEIDAIEAGLAIAGLPLPDMVERWQGNTSVFDYPSNLNAHNPYAFSWLPSAPIEAKGQFVLQGFMGEGDEGSRASFRFSLKPEALEFTRLKAKLGENKISGSVLISRDEAMAKPKVTTTLNVDTLDFASLSPYFYANEASGKESLWSRKHISLIPLDHFDGSGDVRIGELTVGNLNMSSARGKWHLLNRRLTFKSLNGKAYGGDAAMALSLTSAEAPSLVANFRLSRVDAQSLLGDMFDVDAVNGAMTVNGQLKTSGIHFDSWMSNMRGSINMVATNMKVNNMNIEAVSRQIRRKPDIRTLTPMMPDLYASGSTVFDKVDFSGVISDGVLGADKWIISSRSGIAKLSGDFSLVNFLAKIRMETKLISLGRSAPELVVLNEGKINDLQTRFDTSSVERYISRK